VDFALRQHEMWYKGDGMYGDGPPFHWDYYNSFVIQPMLLDVMRLVGSTTPDWQAQRAPIVARARRYAAIQERLISPEGTFPPIGRSLAYRFGAFQLLAQMALRHELPDGLSPAQVRSALTAVMRRMIEAPGTFDAGGWLTIGFCGHQPHIGEGYARLAPDGRVLGRPARRLDGPEGVERAGPARGPRDLNDHPEQRPVHSAPTWRATCERIPAAAGSRDLEGLDV